MLRRISLALIVTLLIAPACLAQGAVKPGSIPTRRALERLGLEKHWMAMVPLGVGEKLVIFNVDDGQLFAQTNHARLHVFDAESGKYQWGAHLDNFNANPLPVSVNSDQAFVTALRTIHALDRTTGRPMWKAELADIPSTGTICDEEVVAVGLRNGKLQGFNARDHSKDDPPGRSAGSFAWAWQSSAHLSSRPVVSPHVVSFASEDHRVYTMLKPTRSIKSKMIHRFLTGGPIKASLATHGNRNLIVASQDFNVYAIDVFTAENRWVIPTGAPIDQEPLVSGDDVVVINQRGRLFLVDGRNGQVKWEQQTDGEKILALSPSRVYVANPHHDLVILDRATGAILHSSRDTNQTAGLDNRELALAFPNYFDDRLYAASAEGMIYCARELGKLDPTPLRAKDVPRFGTIPPEGFTDDGNGTGAAAATDAATDAGTDTGSEPER